MANSNKKLTDLPAVSSVSGTTIFLVDDSSTTQTANGTVVKNYIYNSFFSSTLTLSIDINTTGNITSGNASLGNLTTSGYFSGNGSLLTHIAGANVSGFVPNANVANTAYAVAGANVSGFVPNANIANTSYSVTGGNVSGQVSNALVAGTVYTAAQPNITSVGNLTSLIVLTDGAQGPSGGGLVQTQTDTNTPMGSGNRIAGYFFGGATSTSHTIVNSVSLEAFATQNWTAGAHGSKLIIATTANGASSRTTAITINQDQTSNFANTVTVTGNVSANFILGDGSQLSNISNIANLTQTNGNFTMTGNFLPSLSNTYTLGSPTNKWSDIYVGPNSIHLQDTANSQLDATMTITNGVLLINGANQLQVGQLKFVDNTIESTTGNIDIEIGLASSSANLVLNRNVTLASGKTFTSNGRITATSNTGGTATNGVISINADGTGILPQNPGVMLNITGQGSNPARVYIDGVGTNNYAAIVGRHYNGNSTTPTQLLNNDVISRFAATPYATGGWPAISTTRMDMIADENQTATNQGSRIEFWVTPKGANTVQKQMFIDTSGATVTGDLTVTGTVNITGNLNPITYGIFGNTANITASANTATPILFDTSIANLGVTKGTGSSNSRIIVNKAGSYNVKAQLGVYQNGAGSVTLSTWFRKNGVDVAYSQDSITLNNNPTNVWLVNDAIIPSLVANDYIEVYWALVGSNPEVGHVKLLAQAAQTTPFAMPASPSAIVTIIPV